MELCPDVNRTAFDASITEACAVKVSGECQSGSTTTFSLRCC